MAHALHSPRTLAQFPPSGTIVIVSALLGRPAWHCHPGCQAHTRPLLCSLQLSLEEGAYRADLEGVGARLAVAGMTSAYEERIPPELNAAWQVGGRVQWAVVVGKTQVRHMLRMLPV